jgi:hypothetical protein
MRERLVVVGNGMVGLHFVEELLVRADDRYRITVVGKEPEAAYNRVLLSSLLAGEVSAEEVRFRDRTWCAANGIELILGARAESEAIGLCALSRLSAEATAARLCGCDAGPMRSWIIGMLCQIMHGRSSQESRRSRKGDHIVVAHQEYDRLSIRF